MEVSRMVVNLCEECGMNLTCVVQCRDCGDWYYFRHCKIFVEDEENWKCEECLKSFLKRSSEEKEKRLSEYEGRLAEAKKKIESMHGEIHFLKQENSRMQIPLWLPENDMDLRKADMLLIGDETLKYSWESCIRLGVKVQCLPEIRADQLQRKIEQWDGGRNEELVIVHVGQHDIKWLGYDDYVVGHLWDLCVALKMKFDTAKIIVSGILKRRDLKLSRINYINKGIQWVCDRHGLEFLNLDRLIDKSDLGKDGVRLNRSGSYKMGKYFSEAVLNFLFERKNKATTGLHESVEETLND